MSDDRILVAEDDPVTLRFVVSLLEEKGYEVYEATDGRSALELAAEHVPDLIVTDLVMPYRDGFGLLRAIREHDATRKIPGEGTIRVRTWEDGQVAAQVEDTGPGVADGLGMLVGQAALAFQLWRGVLPEVVPVLEETRQRLIGERE